MSEAQPLYRLAVEPLIDAFEQLVLHITLQVQSLLWRMVFRARRWILTWWQICNPDTLIHW